MRRASAELERRRASLGTTRGLRADGTLDPNYAAILFRDSRGVSILIFCCVWLHMKLTTDSCFSTVASC